MRLIGIFLSYFLYHVGAIGIIESSIDSRLPEDGKLDFPELAAKYGKNRCEEYDVITEDNYILKLFHIKGDATRPVLLAHGLIDSADAYIVRGDKSMAIALEEEGYDLWFMNARGTKYSRRHVTLNPDTDKEFWDFSFHEIGEYDLPANIDFVLDKTNQAKLTMIGFSQGTKIWFVLGSIRPEYNEKLKALIALAPVAYLNNVRYPNKAALTPVWKAANALFKLIGLEELFGPHSIETLVARALCSQLNIGAELCLNVFVFPICGEDPVGLEPEFMPVAIGHCPTSTTRRVINHMVQISEAKKFQQYDYGVAGNLLKYSSIDPPEYPLSKITARVELLVGPNDSLGDAEDAKILNTQLQNSSYREINNTLWNHIDFIWANNMEEYLFPTVIELLSKYT